MRCVIAIDFGTSHSGYAIAFVNGDPPRTWKKWPDSPTQYDKTLSDLLVNDVGDVLAWGYSVLPKLAEMRYNGEGLRAHRLRAYKMSLHGQSPVADAGKSQRSTVFSRLLGRAKAEFDREVTGPFHPVANGKKFPVVDMIAKYLELMRSYALDNIRREVDDLPDQEILWCLTVPAIWTDVDRDRMRYASRRAGLIGDGPDEDARLVLVLEPEAAALYCQERSDALREAGSLKPGTTFMIVDAGGGTVDLTTHKQMLDGNLSEMTPGSGINCGSTKIDKEFRLYLDQRLLARAVEMFHSEDPVSYLELMNAWERTKCNPNIDRPQSIELPVKLIRYLDQLDESILQKLAKEQTGEDTRIWMRPDIMRQLFSSTLNGIVEAIYRQFEALGAIKCDYIFLVGGFAESPLLQDRVIREFGSKVRKVIVPPEPGKSVVHGAVLYGLSPRRIVDRRMRRTYGYKTCRAFRASDPEAYKFTHRELNAPWCDNVFESILSRGQSVSVDKVISVTFYPLYSDTITISIELHSSDDIAVSYTSVSTTTKIASVVIESPLVPGVGRERPIDVEFCFGQTEIRVNATDRLSGKSARVKVRYDT
jgi:molecular chaperone DnaK (HSP70)